MAVVIIGSLLIGCFCLIQGFHILRNRTRRPFFFEEPDDPRLSEPKLSLFDTFFLACVYLFPAVGVFCILTVALFKNDPHRIFEWVIDHIFELFAGLIGLIYGLVALFRPDVLLRKLFSNYPDPEFLVLQTSVQLYARAAGALLAAVILYVFAHM